MIIPEGAEASADTIVNVRDFEELARAILDPEAHAYVSGGAGDESTLLDNEAAFGRRRLRPRIGGDSRPHLGSTLLGTPVSMPIGVAPTAAHTLVWPEGEVATAAGAAAAGALYCLSTSAGRSIEDVAAVAGPWWYQFYRGSGAEGIERALAAGARALALTADVQAAGHRDREFRAQRANPSYPLFSSPGSEYTHPRSDLHSNAAHTGLAWSDVEKIVGSYDIPIVLKGVMTAEDAAIAVDLGVSAIWVSNHGGRQLDRVSATLDVLEEVVDAVDGRAEVYLDGGVRRGTDVAMALALGADAVFLGRPILYALAVAGDHGVRRVLEQYARELSNAMALLGCPDVGSIDGSRVRST